MLTLVGPGTPHTPAYRVPFAIDRSHAPRFELHNHGDERLRGISLSILGSGQLLWGLPTALEPQASLIFAVHGDDIARDSILIVRWFRPSGDEYLWRVSF